MTPAELSRLQDRLGLNDDEFGAALGLTGKHRARTVRRFKTEGVPEPVAAIARELPSPPPSREGEA
jgi:hypothetical protein